MSRESSKEDSGCRGNDDKVGPSATHVLLKMLQEDHRRWCGITTPRPAKEYSLLDQKDHRRTRWMNAVGFNFYGGCIRDRPKSHVPEDGVTRFYQLTILHWKGLELLRCCLLFITLIKSIPPPKPVCGVSSDQSIQSPLPINLKKR